MTPQTTTPPEAFVAGRRTALDDPAAIIELAITGNA